MYLNIFISTYLLDLGRFWIIMNTYKRNSNFIMQNPFTEIELETIANAMDDYINYDDEKLDTELLFGGLSVADRVNSIQTKIDELLTLMETN